MTEKRLFLEGNCLVLSFTNNEKNPYYLISKDYISQNNCFKLKNEKGILKECQETKSMDCGGGNGWDCWLESHWLSGKQNLPCLLVQIGILTEDYSIKDYNNIIKKYVLTNKSTNNEFIVWNSKEKTWVEITKNNKRPATRINDKDSIIKKLKQEIIDNKPILCEDCETKIIDTDYLNIDANGKFYCNDCYYD